MNEKIKRRFGLTFSLVLFVFLVILVGMLLAGILVIILHFTGLVDFTGDMTESIEFQAPIRTILSMILFSTFLGTVLAAFFSRKVLQPIRKVVDATHKIAQGNFRVRVEEIPVTHELGELSRSFNKMAHELSTIETLRSDFVNNFSHELKTPIVSIQGFAKLLKNSHLSESEKQEYLDIIMMESDRLSSLSTNILNLSKYENIEIMPNKTVFHLDEQIRRVIALTEPKWASKEITFDVEMDDITIEANEDLTYQVWLNLLDNTIKFSKQGGVIRIRLDFWNGDVRFSIEDNGIGMDAITQSRVFDKFYQGDTSHTKAGNGLGLSIVKRVVELCGGTIELWSEVGKGSKFLILFKADNGLKTPR